MGGINVLADWVLLITVALLYGARGNTDNTIIFIHCVGLGLLPSVILLTCVFYFKCIA